MAYQYEHGVLLPLLICLLFTSGRGDSGSGSNPLDNSCWENAYQHMFAGCTQILANEEKNSRFAWNLGNCLQKDSGGQPFPHCGDDKDMAHCLKKLDHHEHANYLGFLRHTNNICYPLQTQVFRRETERLVNELKNSEQYTEKELDIIKDTTFTMLKEVINLRKEAVKIEMQHEVADGQSTAVQGLQIKAFFVYTVSILVIYMFTSTKQTYHVRSILYLGLFITFLVEVAILQLTTPSYVQHQARIIHLLRLVFVFLAVLQLLHAIYAYKDYEALIREMMLALTENINGMQREIALSDIESDDEDWPTHSDDVDWPSSIEDDLTEVGSSEDH
ncbi:Protein GAMETE EXPRESSED 1 [Linum grandiflorum]